MNETDKLAQKKVENAIQPIIERHGDRSIEMIRIALSKFGYSISCKCHKGKVCNECK